MKKSPVVNNNSEDYSVKGPSGDNDNKTRSPIRILNSNEFTASWIPPWPVIDGVLQRRYLYALTAQTGTGKTAIALTLAAHVALGRPLGQNEVEQGRVLYFAGENPDDIKQRWLLLAENMRFDTSTVAVDFIDKAFPIAGNIHDIKVAANTRGPYSLVIVDTSAAYYSGDDENDNTQALKHARQLRELINLPGGPCVVVCTHPAKGGKCEPRGGSAFLNEIDGNTYLVRKDDNITLRQHTKFRGPNFQPLVFQLVPVTSRRWRDAKGRPVKSVMAVTTDSSLSSEGRQDWETDLLCALKERPGASLSKLEETIGLDRNKVSRRLHRLKSQALVKQDEALHWHLTAEGEDRCRNVRVRSGKHSDALQIA